MNKKHWKIKVKQVSENYNLKFMKDIKILINEENRN